jgi:hypothetical protein
MYFITAITNWSDTRDSAYRIAPADKGHRHILLNPNRISDLKEADNSTIQIPRSIFKFYDNHLNRREKYSVIEADIAVATIIAAADTPFHSTMITLNIHRDQDPHKATEATTIPVACIAYADKYNQDDEHCWIVYYGAAFQRYEVLADLTIEQLEDIAETGTTSTTTTTDRDDQ